MLFTLQFLLLIGFVYAVLLFAAYFMQEKMIFFRTSARHLDHGLANVESFSLDRTGAILRGWLVNPSYARDIMIIYFGGNAEDVFLNIDEFSDIEAASLFVAYRGYGPSSGTPGQEQLYADSLAIIDKVMTDYAPGRLFIFGRSLGSSVACYVAASRHVDGVILVTPFDSMVNVAKTHYPWLPVSLLLRHRFDSWRYAEKITSPVLVLSGRQDTVVAPARTSSLLSHLPENRTRSVVIERADHANIEMFPEYWQAILYFMNGEEG